MKTVAIAALLLAITATEACEMLEYKRVQATPRAIVFEAAEGTTGVVNGNIIAVLGKDATLIVDTGQFPSIARRIVGELRAMSAPPVRHVVNTHWHGDHLLGNGIFKEAYPAARLIAHSHTIKEAARYYTSYAEQSRKRLPIILEDMRKRREASASEEERLWLSRTLECADAILPQVDDTHYTAPDVTVDDELRIDLGGLRVLVKHLGSANTPGDLVVWVESEGLVAVGDMLVHPVPYAIGSPLAPWAGTLARVRALKPKVIVPGHGPVMRDDSYLRDVAALVKSTHEQLAAFVAQGVPRAEAESRLDTTSFRERYVTSPMRRQAFEQFFVKAAVAVAYRPPS